mmetsp:Transcript_78151/g.242727  ORF Transcript_78151/g.242727 Transcript_78151/m.242727 type:complete len:255 (-) Transcript_78151:776-1540(-)
MQEGRPLQAPQQRASWETSLRVGRRAKAREVAAEEQSLDPVRHEHVPVAQGELQEPVGEAPAEEGGEAGDPVQARELRHDGGLAADVGHHTLGLEDEGGRRGPVELPGEVLGLLVRDLRRLREPVAADGRAVAQGVDVLLALHVQGVLYQDLCALLVHLEVVVLDEAVGLDACTPHQSAVFDTDRLVINLRGHHILLHVLHEGSQVDLHALPFPEMPDGILLQLSVEGVQHVVGEHVHRDILLEVPVLLGPLLA